MSDKNFENPDTKNAYITILRVSDFQVRPQSTYPQVTGVRNFNFSPSMCILFQVIKIIFKYVSNYFNTRAKQKASKSFG